MSDGNRLEMLVKLNPASPYVVVFGQDAIVRSRHPLPRFFRWTWAEGESYSAIFLNDPTLYLNDTISGGWFQGLSDVDYMKETYGHIADLVSSFDIAMENVVFFGASAGGFTSICMGALAKANVLVDIPQTDLLTYHVESARQELLQTCYGMRESYDDFRPRLNAFAFMQTNQAWPKRLWIVQNLCDSRHLRRQLAPFLTDVLESLADERRPLDLRLLTTSRFSTRRGGHIPADEAYTRDRIKEIVEISHDAPVLVDVDLPAESA